MTSVWILAAVALAALAYAWFRRWFLRDPERTVPPGDDTLVSPADGRVLRVLAYDLAVDPDVAVIPKGMLGAYRTLLSDVSPKGWIVSVFMSPLDVHVNRVPMAGEVVSQTHVPGRFGRADRFPHSFLENEKNEVVLRRGDVSIKVIQVAGALARRIRWWVGPGQKVEKGQRYGLIDLGSQCTVILPADRFSVSVAEGERVYAGTTVIARRLPLPEHAA